MTLGRRRQQLAASGLVNIVGGCCGTTPAHLRAVVDALGNNRAPVVRTPEHEPGCSSIYSHVPFHQELAYLAVGERTNANGSRKFRDAMLEADYDTCVAMAREQVKEGAHVLDVCVDYVGRDGAMPLEPVDPAFRGMALFVTLGVEGRGSAACRSSVRAGGRPGRF